MAITIGRSTQAVHRTAAVASGRGSDGRFTKGSKGSIVIEGDDLIVQQFRLMAAAARPAAAAVVTTFAAKAAQRMRDLVPVDEGDLLDSITSDDVATATSQGAYADAGPSRSANDGAFKAHLIERGTVKMGPRPFARPAGDQTLPEFISAMKALASL